MRHHYTVLDHLHHQGYLINGYINYSNPMSYDIDWTMPYCVLALRLIGFAFDLQDWDLPADKKSADQVRHPRVACHPHILIITPGQALLGLEHLPNPLEFFGFCFYFGGFSVGPQFPFYTYKQFVTGQSIIASHLSSSYIPQARYTMARVPPDRLWLA